MNFMSNKSNMDESFYLKYRSSFYFFVGEKWVYVISVWSMLGGLTLFFYFTFKSLVDLSFNLTSVYSFSMGNYFLIDSCYPFILDYISFLFSAVVCWISAWMMMFAKFYMSHELYYRRFTVLVLLFVFSMNLMILSPSMLTLMLGWDGLGVVSFLLVVYNQDNVSYAAGMITVFSNRVGDVFFIIFLAYMMKGLNLEWFMMTGVSSKSMALFLGMMVLLGSITKSAQVPFSAWLPAAMAAPTPVSALVHSSTLVTAGVYVLSRFSQLMGGGLMMGLTVISLMTFLMAGLGAIIETDMKKVVALSTLSQISMMMVALGLGMSGLCFYHLVVHAFFKALMFMCVGALMFVSGGIQDLRYLSSYASKMPFIMSWLLISVMCLCGLPFMSGFYSKDMIIELALGGSSGFLFVLVILMSLMITSAYSFRVVLLLLKGVEIGGEALNKETGSDLIYAVSGLGMSALTGGFLFRGILPESSVAVVLGFPFKMMILFSLLLGFFLGFLLVSKETSSKPSSFFFSFPCKYFIQMFYLNLLSGWWSGTRMLKLFWNGVMNIENFWVTKVIWNQSVVKVLYHVGSLVRIGSMKYFNSIFFVLLAMMIIISCLSFLNK